MFVIKPENAADWQHAMYILSHYHGLVINLYSDAETATSVYMVIRDGADLDSIKALLQVETAFQHNWNQVGMVCPHCYDDTDPCRACEIYRDCGDHGSVNCRPTTCGHLTFNEPIKPAF